jgi:xanthine dehydrogenase YagS FAD-binding subunit
LKAFQYVSPANEREAVAALGAERGRMLPMAGGMDLLGLMKDYIVSPERVVSLRNLDREVNLSGQGLRVGAACTLTDLAAQADVRKLYPALASAADEVGTPQIRNTGTVGGNLMQRPRCWYFRNEEFHCLKKGGSRCYAVDGENQYHAIFGDGPCYIVHPSSLAVPLIAYGARVRVVGPSGAREIDLGELYQLPNQNLYGETVLQPNEIVTHVMVPSPGTAQGSRGQAMSATFEVRLKQSHDWPLAMASVNLTVDEGTVRSARIVMGAVAPVPWRVQGAERVLVGKLLGEAAAVDAAAAAVAGARAMSGNAHKIQIARTTVKRAILKAGGLPVA